MNIILVLFTLVATTWIPEMTCQIPNYPYFHNRQIRQNSGDRFRRQTNADQMVQNILQWLQGVYTKSSRKIRQGTIREYLPPVNTEKPRPFEPSIPERPEDNTIGYPTPPPGIYPPIGPTYPETVPQEPGYPGPEEMSQIPGRPFTQTPEQPQEPNYPTEDGPIEPQEPGYPGAEAPGEEPGYPKPEQPSEEPSEPVGPEAPEQPNYPGPGESEEETIPQEPGYPTPEEEPGPAGPEEQPEAPASEKPYEEPKQPGYSETQKPEIPGQSEIPTELEIPSQPEVPAQPEIPEISGQPGKPEYPTPQLPEETERPEGPEEKGYPPAGETPHPPFALPTEQPESSAIPEGPSPSQQTEEPEQGPPISPETEEPLEPEKPFPQPEEPARTEKQPEPESEVTGYPPVGPSPTPIFPVETEKPEQAFEPSPEVPEEETETYTSAPATSSSGIPYQPGEVLTSAPPAKTDQPEEQPTSPPEETEVTIKPESITPEKSGEPSEEDLKHPPHIHALDVICDQDKMTITVEFNRQFDGIIYSKGNYNNLDCRYVNENSGQTTYEFTVYLNQCGTELVSSGDGADTSYLENVLVMQNEVGIQEVWDTVRAVRCQWEQSLKKSLTASLSVGMLNPEIVTFSGDSIMARLDIQQGEGPFAPTANGLVPIGEKMTLVVTVTGADDYDIQVKDCKAKDTESNNEVLLSDENGCILKPKLFGAFQKLNEPAGPTIAYAFFNAFKFPDIMDLMIECNVELCKEECDMCEDPNQKLRPSRRRRDIVNNTLTDPIRVGKLLRVLLPEDLSNGEAIVKIRDEENICVSVKTFIISTTFMISLLTTATMFSVYIYLKHRRSYHKH